MLDNFYWAMYRKLENEILELTYYIQFTDFGESNNCQKNVFSHKIADLLISICIQIETLFKILYKKELTDTKQHSINQKIKFLDEKYKLSKKKIKLISSEMYFNTT